MTASHSASVMFESIRSRRMPALLIHDVQVAEGVDRRLHQPLGAVEVGHALAVGDRLTAHRLDLGDHLLGRRQVAPGAVDRAAESLTTTLAP